MIFRKALSITCVVFVVLFMVCFLFRNTFLHWGFAQMQKRAHEKYGLHINASSLWFSGFDKIILKDISAIPDGADTLLAVSNAEVNLSLTGLLTGKIAFDKISIDSAFASVYNKPERNNVHFLFSKKKTGEKTSSSLNYYERTKLLAQELFAALSTSFTVNNAALQYYDSASSENISVPLITYNGKTLNGSLINKIESDTVFLSGEVLERKKSFSLSLKKNGRGETFLPFLNQSGKLQGSFESFNAKVTIENSNNQFQIIVNTSGEKFSICHWRIADETVTLPSFHLSAKVNIAPTSIELDSSSVFRIQEVPVKLFAAYHSNPDTIFTLHIQMPETVSDTFFNALPEGMFNTLKGISCTGTLAYDLQFSINTQQPDSLFFSSALTRKNFRINHFGDENFSRINESFTYQAYDKLVPVRKIEISSQNPAFTPLFNISPYLIHAVLQSEDPSFMQHRGFILESFRESIVKNYKERRFARGGSTITMQLVKNVFLKRSKTVSRKAEEALITYLIENLQLVPKERMLEIYLNAIEWGPNVYGIGEASRFYFNKRPVELTLQESIFLAGIIPAPKYFKYQFDEEGKLKTYLNTYFNVITTRMVARGRLSPRDTVALKPDVKLLGPSVYFVNPDADSVDVEEEF